MAKSKARQEAAEKSRRSTQSFTPEPELADRRRMLEGARDELRRQGYATQIDYEVLKAQDLADHETVLVGEGNARRPMKRGEYLRDLQRKVRNCYASAERLHKMLEELPPEPEPEPAAPSAE